MGVALSLILLACAGGVTVVGGTPAGWIRVADARHALSVSVPADWARQLRDSGWNVRAMGLPGDTEPGLQVGADLSSGTSPGLFAGLLAMDVAAVSVPAHPGCLRQPDRSVAAAGRAGRVQRWTSCAGDLVSYDEVVLIGPGSPGVYLQIRQDTRRADQTDEILRTLRVAHS